LHEGSPYGRHIPALDGIRGLAILGVAASHLFPGTPASGVTAGINKLLAFGATGVDLFFVLSGFLITGILYDSLGDAAFFRKFYGRRALRIFPLYYGVLAGFAVAAILLGIHYQGELLSLALYLQNTSIVAPPIYLYQGPMLPLSHFWSLAVEEQFYLVWPLAVFLLRRRQSLLWVCLVSLCACPFLRFDLLVHGVNYLAVNTSTLCRADSLLAGAALALLLRGSADLHDLTLRAGPWLVVLGLAVPPALGTIAPHTALAANPSLFLALGTTIALSAHAASAFGLIACSLRPGWACRVFSMRPLRLLGKYSYGVYVFHLIAFSYLQQPLREAIAAHLTQSKVWGVLLAGLLTFGLTLGAAFLSFQLYERQFLRMKRFLAYDSVITGRE
jgi:peptidoglycan/LPS O-acetylase OafA/YrhL